MFSKTALICLLSIVFISTGASAFPPLKCGLELGINYSGFIHKDSTNPEITSDWNWDNWHGQYSGGIFGEISLSTNLKLVPCFRFVRYGARIQGSESLDVLEASGQPVNRYVMINYVRQIQDYVALAICVKHYPTTSPHFYVVAGPELGYLLAAHYRINGPSIYQQQYGFGMTSNSITISGYNVNITRLMNRFNFSAGVGIGYQLPLGKRTSQVEFRYTRGLNDNFKIDNPLSDFPNWKTHGLELVIGFIW